LEPYQRRGSVMELPEYWLETGVELVRNIVQFYCALSSEHFLVTSLSLSRISATFNEGIFEGYLSF